VVSLRPPSRLCRVLSHLGVKLKPNTCFGIVSGAHTYFLAADTPEEVRRSRDRPSLTRETHRETGFD
jgi:hypothetical protein